MKQFTYKTHEGHEKPKPYAKLKWAILNDSFELPYYNYSKLPTDIRELLREYHIRNKGNFSHKTKITKRIKMINPIIVKRIER